MRFEQLNDYVFIWHVMQDQVIPIEYLESNYEVMKEPLNFEDAVIETVVIQKKEQPEEVLKQKIETLCEEYKQKDDKNISTENKNREFYLLVYDRNCFGKDEAWKIYFLENEKFSEIFLKNISQCQAAYEQIKKIDWVIADVSQWKNVIDGIKSWIKTTLPVRSHQRFFVNYCFTEYKVLIEGKSEIYSVCGNWPFYFFQGYCPKPRDLISNGKIFSVKPYDYLENDNFKQWPITYTDMTTVYLSDFFVKMARLFPYSIRDYVIVKQNSLECEKEINRILSEAYKFLLNETAKNTIEEEAFYCENSFKFTDELCSHQWNKLLQKFCTLYGIPREFILGIRYNKVVAKDEQTAQLLMRALNTQVLTQCHEDVDKVIVDRNILYINPKILTYKPYQLNLEKAKNRQKNKQALQDGFWFVGLIIVVYSFYKLINNAFITDEREAMSTMFPYTIGVLFILIMDGWTCVTIEKKFDSIADFFDQRIWKKEDTDTVVQNNKNEHLKLEGKKVN